MWLLRWILFPLTILYTLAIWVRNKLYDLQILSSKSFPVNTIVIGNLAVGGAGKSPITQKCVAYFTNKYKVATLSRGYGRSTQGFMLVEKDHRSDQVGDEPLQMKHNFDQVTVAVDEDRAHGIEILQQNHDLILLDDAYQHRKIIPKCALLLFDYPSILGPIWLLPTGNFRDTMNQTKRADVVLITKCPRIVAEQDKKKIETIIRKYNNRAPIYYSQIRYLSPEGLNDLARTHAYEQAKQIILLTGIANPKPLLDYLTNKHGQVDHLSYPDHHDFTSFDYLEIKAKFAKIKTKDAILVTTEKDAQRLSVDKLGDIPLYYIPIAMDIQQERDFFDVIEQRLNSPARPST